MCGPNCNTQFVKLIIKGTTDVALRECFLANPRLTAQEFGFTEYDQNELARYDVRKLRARRWAAPGLAAGVLPPQ